MVWKEKLYATTSNRVNPPLLEMHNLSRSNRTPRSKSLDYLIGIITPTRHVNSNVILVYYH